MKLLRTPQPNAHLPRLENCGSAELLGLFEIALKRGIRSSDSVLLADAWGRLFAGLFLSAEELVDGMQQEERRFSPDHEQMMRDFIRADCAAGGRFVFTVIKTGGNIDRAALFMIAGLEDFAGIEEKGISAIQLLLDACDRRVRPALIRKAGKRLLSQVYDRRGIPLLYSIFGLCDLGYEDLDAISSVFTDDELRNIMSRSRTGKNALEVFTGLAASMKRYPPMERNASMVRNAFYIPAAKDTKKDGPDQPARIRKISTKPAKDERQDRAE